MNLRGGRRVESAEHPMQIACSLLFSAFTQPLAQLLGTLRTGEQAFQQRAQIQASPADYDRQSSPLLDLVQDLAGLAGVFASGDVAGRLHKIEEVMGNAGALGGRGFGGANLELAKHGDRITVHNLPQEAFGQSKGEGSLAASRGAEHNYKQGLGRRGQRAPQAM